MNSCGNLMRRLRSPGSKQRLVALLTCQMDLWKKGSFHFLVCVDTLGSRRGRELRHSMRRCGGGGAKALCLLLPAGDSRFAFKLPQ